MAYTLSHNKCLPSMITALRRRGYGTLGQGFYGYVMAKDGSDKVIKIANEKLGDQTWERYVVWAHHNGYAGNFAPYVYALHDYDWGFIAVVERLDMTLGQLTRKRYDNAPLPPKLRMIPDYADCFRAPENMRNLNKLYPGFGRFINHAIKAGFTRDWNDGNWMFKGTDRIVLTDPQGPCGRPHSVSRWNHHTVKQLELSI